METEKLARDAREKALADQKARRDIYFAHIATFMKGAPKLTGERLRKTLACCPPKQYREAIHA